MDPVLGGPNLPGLLMSFLGSPRSSYKLSQGKGGWEVASTAWLVTMACCEHQGKCQTLAVWVRVTGARKGLQGAQVTRDVPSPHTYSTWFLVEFLPSGVCS